MSLCSLGTAHDLPYDCARTRLYNPGIPIFGSIASEGPHSHVRRFKQQAQKIFACLYKRLDHETTVDRALMRGLVTAGAAMIIPAWPQNSARAVPSPVSATVMPRRAKLLQLSRSMSSR